MKELTAATAKKIKAEHDRLMSPENLAKQSRNKVKEGPDAFAEVAALYRRFKERYTEQLCKKYRITPDVLASIVAGEFEPTTPVSTTDEKRWWQFWK